MGQRKGQILKYFLVVLLVFGLTGCGKSAECAICGAEGADRILTIEGQEISICTECYKTYIEIQQLFQEER